MQANILLDGADQMRQKWKICDFGEAKVLRSPQLQFGQRREWRCSYTHALAEAQRLKPVTSRALRAAGARWYCWLLPGEWVKDASGRQPWQPCGEHGGFVFLFSEEPQPQPQTQQPPRTALDTTTNRPTGPIMTTAEGPDVSQGGHDGPADCYFELVGAFEHAELAKEAEFPDALGERASERIL